MGVNETPRDPGYEQRDVSLRGVIVFAASLIATLVIVHFLALGVFHRLARERSASSPVSPLAATREPFAGPRLLVNQKQDMEAFRASEDATLNNYGWVDRQQGIVHIPIDRAIDLLAQRGITP